MIGFWWFGTGKNNDWGPVIEKIFRARCAVRESNFFNATPFLKRSQDTSFKSVFLLYLRGIKDWGPVMAS
jgi:hypothetical protein